MASVRVLRPALLVAGISAWVGCFDTLDPEIITCQLDRPSSCPSDYHCRLEGGRARCRRPELDSATGSPDSKSLDAEQSGTSDGASLDARRDGAPETGALDTGVRVDGGDDARPDVPGSAFDGADASSIPPPRDGGADVPLGTGGVPGSDGAPAELASGSGGTRAGGGSSGTGGNAGGSGVDAAATGGVVGTGGAGTGGVAVTGGVTGTGGPGTGTGGPGAGGSPGTGGAATGGVTGTGGGTGPLFVEDEGADCALPDPANLPDPSLLPSVVKLPDPFKKLNGSRVLTKPEWRCRRAEIKLQAEAYVYGTKPRKPEIVTGTVSTTRITVQATEQGKSSSFFVDLTVPSGTGPFPVVVVLTTGKSVGASMVDYDTILGEGVAMIPFSPLVVGDEGTERTSKRGKFYDIYGSGSTTGLLAAWAWGVSRIIDVIQQSDGSILKADAIGVTGCGRGFGKGAFVAGAMDQRIALTMPVESGTGGVPIFRGVGGEGAEDLGAMYAEKPWIGDVFSAFTSDPSTLPLDTHEVVAMIAPRGLFIMDNPFMVSTGPKSAHVAALGGAEVYSALGAGANLTYWSDIEDSTYCAIRPEWKAPLQQNLRKFLTKTANDPGAIVPASSATGDLADWRDWTTPTLH